MPETDREGLLAALAELERRVRPQALESDPVRFPRRYRERGDREAAALLAALYAYGNVKSMGAFLEALFGLLGDRPAEVLQAGAVPPVPPYRFQSSADGEALLRGVGRLLAGHGTLESAFAAGQGGPEERLEAFAGRLREAAERDSPGLRHLLPRPSGGSACKRWRLFLRWVVRPDDGVDLGLWTVLRPSDLVVPLDTHLSRLSRALGLSPRRSEDGARAREVTEALRNLCPQDPCRFDFLLAHTGIQKRCRGRLDGETCPACPLAPHCPEGSRASGRRPSRKTRRR
ncbi:MAG: TIGR02757 family protein [Acidobacteriota bacterium]